MGRSALLLAPPADAAPDADDDLFDALAAEDAEEDPAPSLSPHALPWRPRLALEPRSYQREALAAWLAEGGRGVVVLPTGAGKTVVALMAVERLALRTLVVVPTIDLLRQWEEALRDRLGAPSGAVGVVGGGRQRQADLTVITYDSAAAPRRRLDRYGLLVVDEAHHLPAATYRSIAARVAAPFRLGLSATPERADGRHDDLDRLIGPCVYRRLPAELARERHIAAYRERRIYVDLSTEERMRYNACQAEYRWYQATRRTGRGPAFFQELVRRSAFDAAARRALTAHRQARLIALNATAKIARVEALLRLHRDEQVIIFSEYTALVDEISRRLMIPAITYRTPAEERRAILAAFRAGRYSKLVTGRVLNEGVDVPDASVAIIVSGSAAMREYIQRLGRVLRPKEREAVLYELITRRTTEANAARRRRPPAA